MIWVIWNSDNFKSNKQSSTGLPGIWWHNITQWCMYIVQYNRQLQLCKEMTPPSTLDQVAPLQVLYIALISWWIKYGYNRTIGALINFLAIYGQYKAVTQLKLKWVTNLTPILQVQLFVIGLKIIKTQNLNKDVSKLNCLFLFQCFIPKNVLTLQYWQSHLHVCIKKKHLQLRRDTYLT